MLFPKVSFPCSLFISIKTTGYAQFGYSLRVFRDFSQIIKLQGFRMHTISIFYIDIPFATYWKLWCIAVRKTWEKGDILKKSREIWKQKKLKEKLESQAILIYVTEGVFFSFRILISFTWIVSIIFLLSFPPRFRIKVVYS